MRIFREFSDFRVFFFKMYHSQSCSVLVFSALSQFFLLTVLIPASFILSRLAQLHSAASQPSVPAQAPQQLNGHSKPYANGHTNGHSNGHATPSPPPVIEQQLEDDGTKKRMSALERMSNLALTDNPAVAKHGEKGTRSVSDGCFSAQWQHICCVLYSNSS